MKHKTKSLSDSPKNPMPLKITFPAQTHPMELLVTGLVGSAPDASELSV